MFISKYFFILFVFPMISNISNRDDKNNKKKLFQRCERKVIGTECGLGMECSKKYHICLRTKNQLCFQDRECISFKCRKQRCM